MFPLSVKDYVIILLFISAILFCVRIYHDGAKNAVANITAQSLTEATDVKEKQNAIRNNKPSVDAVAKRMQHNGI